MLDGSSAERVRQEVLARGWRRVILLGTPDQMAGPGLRRPLAASGVLVLVPGADDRERIGSMIDAGMVDEAWLAAMLAHGLEHGAEAVVVANSQLDDAVGRLGLPVPVLACE